MTDDTYVISYMATYFYKVVNTHAYETSGLIILSILIHSLDSHIGGMNGVFQSDLAILEFNNGENLKVFMSEFLDFNRKYSSLEKHYPLQYLYSIT